MFIEGKECGFRPLEESDINERYLAWMNDPSVNFYSRRSAWPTTYSHLQAFNKADQKNSLLFGIIHHGDHVGNIMIDKIEWVHRKAEISIMIGEKSCWNKGVGTEAWTLMERHGFLKLNLNRLAAGTINPAMTRIFGKLGWRLEGIFREAFFIDGRYLDENRYGMLRGEWLTSRET